MRRCGSPVSFASSSGSNGKDQQLIAALQQVEELQGIVASKDSIIRLQHESAGHEAKRALRCPDCGGQMQGLAKEFLRISGELASAKFRIIELEASIAVQHCGRPQRRLLSAGLQADQTLLPPTLLGRARQASARKLPLQWSTKEPMHELLNLQQEHTAGETPLLKDIALLKDVQRDAMVNQQMQRISSENRIKTGTDAEHSTRHAEAQVEAETHWSHVTSKHVLEESINYRDIDNNRPQASGCQEQKEPSNFHQNVDSNHLVLENTDQQLHKRVNDHKGTSCPRSEARRHPEAIGISASLMSRTTGPVFMHAAEHQRWHGFPRDHKHPHSGHVSSNYAHACGETKEPTTEAFLKDIQPGRTTEAVTLSRHLQAAAFSAPFSMPTEHRQVRPELAGLSTFPDATEVCQVKTASPSSSEHHSSLQPSHHPQFNSIDVFKQADSEMWQRRDLAESTVAPVVAERSRQADATLAPSELGDIATQLHGCPRTGSTSELDEAVSHGESSACSLRQGTEPVSEPVSGHYAVSSPSAPGGSPACTQLLEQSELDHMHSLIPTDQQLEPDGRVQHATRRCQAEMLLHSLQKNWEEPAIQVLALLAWKSSMDATRLSRRITTSRSAVTSASRKAARAVGSSERAWEAVFVRRLALDKGKFLHAWHVVVVKRHRSCKLHLNGLLHRVWLAWHKSTVKSLARSAPLGTATEQIAASKLLINAWLLWVCEVSLSRAEALSTAAAAREAVLRRASRLSERCLRSWHHHACVQAAKESAMARAWHANARLLGWKMLRLTFLCWCAAANVGQLTAAVTFAISSAKAQQQQNLLARVMIVWRALVATRGPVKQSSGLGGSHAEESKRRRYLESCVLWAWSAIAARSASVSVLQAAEEAAWRLEEASRLSEAEKWKLPVADTTWQEQCAALSELLRVEQRLSRTRGLCSSVLLAWTRFLWHSSRRLAKVPEHVTSWRSPRW